SFTLVEADKNLCGIKLECQVLLCRDRRSMDKLVGCSQLDSAGTDMQNRIPSCNERRSGRVSRTNNVQNGMTFSTNRRPDHQLCLAIILDNTGNVRPEWSKDIYTIGYIAVFRAILELIRNRLASFSFCCFSFYCLGGHMGPCSKPLWPWGILQQQIPRVLALYYRSRNERTT